VLEAIYGAYAIDWQGVSGATPRESLSEEAVYLATLLATLLDDEPEALGLAALLCLSHARAGARLAHDGRFVPLEEQDPARWDPALIREGEAYLRRAHACGRPGRFQLEAAIQSVHCARATTGTIDWQALRKLHSALVRVAPTLGAKVALAATLGETDGPAAGLAFLDGIDHAAVERFQPAWATRAHLLVRAGRHDEAQRAYAKAVSLTADLALRRHLEERAARLSAAAPLRGGIS
jgi:RNA polymerase sigma-70 factor (ECF subfamily)